MSFEDPREQAISVRSREPNEGEDEEARERRQVQAQKKAAITTQSNGTADSGLSEEDEQLKNELEMLVERLSEDNKDLYRPALESLRTYIRTSTSSMTSVPKPLKFLRPHFARLKELYSKWPDSNRDKSLFAEVLSVLAMTYSDNGQRETLHFRLAADHSSVKPEHPGLWGHEYVRHLSTELGDEYNARSEREEDASELLGLALQIVEFSMKHNAEADAVDLLLELEAVEQLPQFVDKDTYERVCLYLISCVNLLVPPDDVLFLRTAHEIYCKHHRFFEALVLALRLADPALVRSDFEAPTNVNMRKQMAFLLSRQQVPLEWVQDDEHPIEDQELLGCLYGSQMSPQFIAFGKELGIYEPKSLEDVYKTHLENSRTSLGSAVDSARGNLANVFVNAFVNAGFGNEPLIIGAEEGSSYVYKVKDHGKLSATASLGLGLMWDTETGLSTIDKYTYSSDEFIKAGAHLAYGILHSGVRTELDAPMMLLSEHVESKSMPLKMASIIGLAIAYAGSQREEALAFLLPNVQDENNTMETAALSSLALGFIFVGSAHGEIVSSTLQTLMEREPSQLNDKWTRFMALGLALLFLGQQENSDATMETLKAIEHPVSKEMQILVDACSYAGTGNVLKIQTLLHYCAEHAGPDAGKQEEGGEQEGDANEDGTEVHDLYQAFAVLAIALVAMGEDVGAEMTLRHMAHLMHYGDPVIRRTVPLALALLNPSNPAIPVLDTLSKYSHDSDLDVAVNAIMAMGLVGAGTNNARLAQRLRQLASYYYKEPDCLFVVRVAQGLVHMGKGALGIDPYHTDRLLFSGTAVAGLLATLMAFTDSRGFTLDRTHWMLYFLATAMRPRFLITLDEQLNTLPVSVRVGKAVDVVGQAGRPRTISGFQTHNTPVRLGSHERGVLATEEYLSYAPIMEGFVILHKNPGNEEAST